MKVLAECPDCGARFWRAADRSTKRCRHPVVDEATPYVEDRLCRALVAANPGGMPLETIGLVLGNVSRERVRQIEELALRKLARAIAEGRELLEEETATEREVAPVRWETAREYLEAV